MPGVMEPSNPPLGLPSTTSKFNQGCQTDDVAPAVNEVPEKSLIHATDGETLSVSTTGSNLSRSAALESMDSSIVATVQDNSAPPLESFASHSSSVESKEPVNAAKCVDASSNAATVQNDSAPPLESFASHSSSVERKERVNAAECSVGASSNAATVQNDSALPLETFASHSSLVESKEPVNAASCSVDASSNRSTPLLIRISQVVSLLITCFTFLRLEC